MATSIATFKPTIKRRDMDAVLNCLVSEEIGPGELSATLVKQLSSYLGISGEEFLHRLDAGDLDENDSDVSLLMTLIPLVR